MVYNLNGTSDLPILFGVIERNYRLDVNPTFTLSATDGMAKRDKQALRRNGPLGAFFYFE